MATTWNLKHQFSAAWSADRSRDAETAEIIEKGDFRIDLAARRATVRGQELPLTSVEFDVLVFLVRHPKKLVTPRTLLTTNWQGQRTRQVEFLSVLLSLRKKLEGAGCAPCIRTEPWILYRFDPSGL